jgi:restriction system protein
VLAAESARPVAVDPVEVLLTALQSFWWLWAVIAVIGVGRVAWRIYQWRRLARSGIAEIDRMDGRTFERFLIRHFRRLGYRVDHTGRRGDYGADLVVVENGRRTVVQAKRWTKNVGVQAVQEAVSAKAMYECTAAMVVTNRAFTSQAETLARANDVVLWDRDVLVRQLLGVSKVDEPEANVVVNDSSQESDERCAVCRVAVSAKVREYCRTHSKRFGGRIYCFDHQRLVRPGA